MAKRFFWVDLEMTGLDHTTDQILEVAVVVTDMQLKPLAELHRIVFQPIEVLDRMTDFVRDLHQKSGLTQAVSQGTPLAEVEKELISLIESHFDPKERVVLAGNSVGNDKRFIDQYLPEVAKRLHYRIVDVSSFKEVFRERYRLNFEKKNAHRAVDDIYESIRELEYYLSYVKTP